MSIRIDGTNTAANPGITGADADTGLQFGTDEVSIVTGGTEKVKVDGSGRVGIGTSSPSTKCVISNGGAEGLEFGHSSGTNEVNSYNRNASARAPVDIIAQTFKVLTGNPSLNTGLFQDSSGNVGINVSNPTSRLHINGTVTINNVGSGAGTNALRYSTSTGRVTYDASSARYKDNIRDSDKGLADLMLLKSRKFEYKDSSRTDIGLVAEEVVGIIPELVTLDFEGLPEAVNYDRFVSVLIKSLQEATLRIETLETQNASLEARLTALEGGAS